MKKKVLFRPHRADYDQAMSEVHKVGSLDELYGYLLRTDPFLKPGGKIKVTNYGDIDERNGWDTHLVTWDDQPVGFTNGPLE